MVDTRDLKSLGPKGRAGSSPVPGTEKTLQQKNPLRTRATDFFMVCGLGGLGFERVDMCPYMVKIVRNDMLVQVIDFQFFV